MASMIFAGGRIALDEQSQSAAVPAIEWVVDQAEAGLQASIEGVPEVSLPELF